MRIKGKQQDPDKPKKLQEPEQHSDEDEQEDDEQNAQEDEMSSSSSSSSSTTSSSSSPSTDNSKPAQQSAEQAQHPHEAPKAQQTPAVQTSTKQDYAHMSDPWTVITSIFLDLLI